MCHIFIFLWDQGVHMLFFERKTELINCFRYEKYFYWVSSFKISFYDGNVNPINILKDHMGKYDKSKYLWNAFMK